MDNETTVAAYEQARELHARADGLRGETAAEMRRKSEAFTAAAEAYRAVGRYKDAVETAKECDSAARVWREKSVVYKRARTNLYGGHVYRGDNPIARVMSNAMLKKKFFTRILAGVVILVTVLILQHFAIKIIGMFVVSSKYDFVYETCVEYSKGAKSYTQVVNEIAAKNDTDEETARIQVDAYIALREGVVLPDGVDPLLIDKLAFYIIMTERAKTGEDVIESLRTTIELMDVRGEDTGALQGVDARMSKHIEKLNNIIAVCTEYMQTDMSKTSHDEAVNQLKKRGPVDGSVAEAAISCTEALIKSTPMNMQLEDRIIDKLLEYLVEQNPLTAIEAVKSVEQYIEMRNRTGMDTTVLQQACDEYRAILGVAA